MDRGWCLAVDKSDQFFETNPVFCFNLSPRLDHRSKGLIMFPVNSRGREDHTAASSPAEGEERVVDFFAEKKKPVNAIKKEESHAEASTDVNTGLQLVTANTGSDQSTVDDGMSYDAEDKRAKIENDAENQRLKGMLSQVSSNYSTLQMHLVTLMQQQQNSTTDSTHEQEVADRKSEEKKENGGQMVPRQFLDLGQATVDEQSNSISEERTLSGSPPNTKGAFQLLRFSLGRGLWDSGFTKVLRQG